MWAFSSVRVVLSNSFIFGVWVSICCCLRVTLSSDFEPGGKPEIKLINPDAEAVIGAAVNVRERGAGLFGCGERTQEGVITADALKWVVDELNRKIWSGSSSNVSLGLQIMDGCGRTRTSASQLIDFLPELQNNENATQEKLPLKFCLVDDIGLGNEPDISKSLQDINVAVVDTNINTNSPQVLINAILLFIQELRWEHAAIVHSNSRFSSSMLKQFIKTLKKFDLCVPWVVNLEDDDEDELHNVLQSGIPVLSLLPSEEHPKILKSFQQVPNLNKKVTVMFSDSISRNQLRMISSSVIQIFAVIPLPEKETSFENFYSKNSIMSGIRMEDELDLVQRTKIVRKIKRIGENLSESLRNAMLNICHEKERLCPELFSEGRKSIFDILEKTDWTNNEQGYELVEYQYQFSGEHVHLHKIMAYNGHKNLDIFETNISFFDINCDGDSSSRLECRCLEVKSVRSGSARNIDDWGRKKQKHSKHISEKDKYTPSKVDVQHVDQQLSKPMVFATLNDPFNGTLACLTLLGGLITLVIAQYFATFAALPNGGFTSGTTVIGFVILIGLFLLFSTNLSFLLTPSVPMCTLRRFCSSFSYAIIFSGMLIKVWTSLRQLSSPKTTLWKPFNLLIYSGAFSFFQILPIGLWLILKPPSVEFAGGRWNCYSPTDMDSHLIFTMIYPITLLLITLILAIRTCSKSNIDEVRWILISSSLAAIIFCCWGMAIATGVWQMHRTACTNLAVATILLLCLYVPKIKTHSKLKKSLKSQSNMTPEPIEIDKECPVFTPSPQYPVVMNYNVGPPVLTKEIIEPNYLNEAYSNDESSETLSTPFDLDSSSYSELDQEPPHTFSTFLEDPQVPKLEENNTSDDPTQVIPSALYPIEMFNNEPIAVTSDHCQPGTNEFTPPHRATSQLYLCPQPDWVP